jgi:tetratricopeptide (TPR) repeat protein
MAFSCLKLGRIDRCIDHFARLHESDASTNQESFRLLLLIAREEKAAPLVPQLLIHKSALLQGASFDQLGQLASCLALNGRVEALTTLFEILHHRVAEVEALLGGVIDHYTDQNRLAELLPGLETLSSGHPCHAPFLSALGVVCIKLGNFFRAIEAYSGLARLIPEDQSISRTLAGLYVSVGNEAQALQTLQGR